jgi:hypothetical protein
LAPCTCLNEKSVALASRHPVRIIPSLLAVGEQEQPLIEPGEQLGVHSEHATTADEFAEIDRLSAEMVRTGASSSAVELIVVDADGRVVTRPMAH